MNKTLAHTLAEYVANFKLKDMDANSIKNAKLAIMDSIGCGIAGSTDQAVELLINTLKDAEEYGKIPIFGKATQFLPGAAALINGTMIHAKELDDTHSFSSVHPGSSVIASALTACSNKATDGIRFIEAVVVGYEISCRIGTAIRGESPYHRGFHPTGICGVFGSATAVGKVYGFNPREYLHAWGLSGSMASGLMAYLQNGAWTKKLHPGLAAQSGFLSASLSNAGFLGPDDIFQGQYGFLEAYSNKVDINSLSQGLGSIFEINRISYKPFACCRTIHAPITAALELKKRLNIQPIDIEEIHAVIADEDIPLVVEPLEKKKQPKTPVEAQFSMPFGVALALVEGNAMHDQYTREKVKDRLIRRLTAKFTYTISQEYTKLRPLFFPCKLSIRIGEKWHSAYVKAPLGDYTNPLSEDQMIAKFRSLCDPLIGVELRQGLETFILSFDQQKEAHKIGNLFRIH
ncbi:MmgE/PrpD family protein [Thermodesulfobacteriota bacterium]